QNVPFRQTGRQMIISVVISPVFPFVILFMFFAVMTWMMVVIILNGVPMVIGKSKGDRCRNGYSYTGLNCDRTCVMAMSTAVIMYNAPRSKNGGQKQDRYKRNHQGSSPHIRRLDRELLVHWIGFVEKHQWIFLGSIVNDNHWGNGNFHLGFDFNMAFMMSMSFFISMPWVVDNSMPWVVDDTARHKNAR
ncbi:MAG: hypothetical protein V3T45_05395, partial [Nitrospinaceae bacterium]